MASGYSDLSEIRKDRGRYGLEQKPPKINLLNEKPRRESLVEQQLTSTITRPSTSQFYNVVGKQQQVQTGLMNQDAPTYGSQQQQDRQSTFNQVSYQQPQYTARMSTSRHVDDYDSNLTSGTTGPDGLGETTSTRTYVGPMGVTTVTKRTVTTTTNSASGQNSSQTDNQGRSYVDLAQDLAEKETKLKREIAYLNQQLSPWARPPQIREPRREPAARSPRSEQRWVKECPNESSSRTSSRASSTRSTVEADLKDKVDKLLHDVEEMESKPLKTQQILIESGARQSSKSASPQPSPGNSVHTAIIRVPRGEVDNKSPLPFAFDNFSTLGVRGNIASVGAAPPETPYPPIFPMIKRSPSPGLKPNRS